MVLPIHNKSSLQILRWRFRFDSEIFHNTLLPFASELTYSLHGVESFLRSYQFSAIQEIPHIFWNKKFHYRIYKMSPTVPFLSHINPIQSCYHTTCWRSILVLSSHLRPGILHGHLPSGLPPKTIHALRLSHYKPHTEQIIFLFVWLTEQRLMKSIRG